MCSEYCRIMHNLALSCTILHKLAQSCRLLLIFIVDNPDILILNFFKSKTVIPWLWRFFGPIKTLPKSKLPKSRLYTLWMTNIWKYPICKRLLCKKSSKLRENGKVKIANLEGSPKSRDYYTKYVNLCKLPFNDTVGDFCWSVVTTSLGHSSSKRGFSSSSEFASSFPSLLCTLDFENSTVSICTSTTVVSAEALTVTIFLFSLLQNL